MNLEMLRAALKKALEAVSKFPDSIKGDDGNPRPMTAEERKTYKELMDKVDELGEEIKLAERAARNAVEEVRTAGGDRVPAAPKSADKPYKTFGSYLKDVAQAGMNGVSGQNFEGLVWGKAAGANETVASEGGFLVQEDFSTQLLNLMHETGAIMSRVTNIPLSANSNAIKLPTIDETSRARGSRWGGVRAYWTAEGEALVDSKPKFGEISLGLNKLAAMGYATEEILQDSTALEAIMLQAFGEELRFEVEDAIVNGNGVGKPLGYMNSGALITVNKESSQAAGTLTFTNLTDMLDRLPARSRRNAVWLIADSGTESALYSITLPGAAGYPIYLPPGQSATPGNAAFGTLLGRPVIPVEYLPALGTAGDICLVDLSEYLTIDKGGIRASQSMHVRFIYDEMAFKMVYRIDGKPAWRQPVTTANGAITKSPFVALQTRD